MAENKYYQQGQRPPSKWAGLQALSTGSTGQYSFVDEERKRQGGAVNPQSFVGGMDQYMPTLHAQMNGQMSPGNSYVNQWSDLQDLQRKFPAGPESSTFDPKTLGQSTGFETPFSWSGAAGKVGDWMGNNPMKVAGLGLGLWDQINKSKQLSQNEAYMGDVRNAMQFDQADVNRRWDLTMKDYNSRQARDAKFDNSQRLPTEV
jgi:hypothetical protein